jgi:hypothetical protein
VADQIALRVAESQVSAGSAVAVTADFRTRSSASASTPTSVRYRVDCLTTGRQIINWTEVSPASSVTITIPGTSNEIVDSSNNLEVRQIHVIADYGLSTQLAASKEWRVRNILNFPSPVVFEHDLRLEAYHPITAAETAAGLAESDLDTGYTPGDIRRYGTNATPGTTDMSAAITTADSVGEPVYFPPGTYAAHNVNMTTSWVMADGAKILFNGDLDDPCVIVSGSNLYGRLEVSGNDESPSRLVNITGSNNRFSRIVVSDIESPNDVGIADVNVALRVGGDNNVIDEVIGRDLVNTGHTNASSPQMLTFAGTATGNSVGRVTGHTITSCVLTASTGVNYVGDIAAISAADNGLYCTAGEMAVGSLMYDGDDEAAVFISGADASLSSLIVRRAANTGIRLLDAGIVEIGTVQYHNNGAYTAMRIGSGSTACGALRIARMQGELSGDVLFYMPSDRGTLGQLVIGSADITYHAVDGTVNPGNFVELRAVQALNFGQINITIVDDDDALTGSDIFNAYLLNPLIRPSTVRSFNVTIVDSDEATFSDAVFLGRNFVQPMMTLYAGVLSTDDGPYLRKTNNTQPMDGLYTPSIPSVGVWKRGQVIWRTVTSANTAPGWACTTAGDMASGGVFKEFANVDS